MKAPIHFSDFSVHLSPWRDKCQDSLARAKDLLRKMMSDKGVESRQGQWSDLVPVKGEGRKSRVRRVSGHRKGVGIPEPMAPVRGAPH